jgi:zinc D-Ala-D-Ala carboxypeptidase
MKKQYRNRRHSPKKTSKLSEHFSKRDFVCRESGEFKISLGLIGALELLRTKCGKRINIVKGFQNVESAEKSGKVSRNYHTKGIAADIQIDNIDIKEAFKIAEEVEEFKGIGLNFEDNYLHVDVRKNPERKCWVEEGLKELEITEENRASYLG